jgi:hypothetical protein
MSKTQYKSFAAPGAVLPEENSRVSNRATNSSRRNIAAQKNFVQTKTAVDKALGQVISRSKGQSPFEAIVDK